MPVSSVARDGNALLRALTRDQLQHWLADVVLVTLEHGDGLPTPATEVYFPTTAVCSVVTPTNDAGVEAAVIGNEGIVPPWFANGVERSVERVVVLVGGEALRVPLPSFRRAVDGSPRFRRMLAIFSQSLLTHAMQVSGCSRRHPVAMQTARWLLAARDRLGDGHVAVTHATLARMLGVRRSSVTVAADALRSAGAIDYTRGSIRIVDGQRLRSASCDCYETLRRAREDVLSA